MTEVLKMFDIFIFMTQISRNGRPPKQYRRLQEARHARQAEQYRTGVVGLCSRPSGIQHKDEHGMVRRTH